MPVTYESWLVLLSIVMAIQGAYVGLSLAVQIADATGTRRRLLLAGATVSLALAIWTMHFVGMLSVRLNFPVDYLVFPTLLSFLVCAIVVGAAVFATSSGPFTPLRLTLSACLMGGGIFSMHYLGMSALDASTYMIHDRFLSPRAWRSPSPPRGWRFGLRPGAAGVRRFFSRRSLSASPSPACTTRRWAASRFIPTRRPPPGRRRCRPTFSPLSSPWWRSASPGFFCCCSCPTSRARRSRSNCSAVIWRAAPAVEMAASPATVPAATGGNGDDPQFGRGTYAPLGGAGAPPRRFARHLPIEREGGTHFLAVDDVVAIHANAHYTYIFDGSDKLFCPLAIGNVESRLDNNRFVRVHRSHIVNIDRVVGYKRSGDNELVEMAGVQHYVVPVSRSRIGPLKMRVAALTGTDPALASRRRHRLASQ